MKYLTKLVLLIAGLLSASLAQQEVLRINGQAGNALGLRIFDAGDVDQDGVPDIVTGTYVDECPQLVPIWCATETGSVRAYSGRDGHLIWIVPGTPGQRLAAYMAQIEDANQDGVADYAVCDHPLEPPDPAGIYTHHVGVLSGSTGQWLHLTTILQPGDGINYRPPSAIAGIGDVNADGRGDYAFNYTVAAPGSGFFPFDYTNYVDICDGLTGVVLRRHSTPAGTDDFSYNTPVSVRDIDADGYGDYALFHYATQYTQLAGDIYSGIDGSIIRAIATQPGMTVGSVTLCDDADQLGYEDIVIADDSVRCVPPSGPQCGIAICISVESGQVLWIRNGAPNQFLGYSVLSSIDMNADGVSDLAVVHGNGEPWILSGATGQDILQFSGMAKSFCCLADVTGDGARDFAIGRTREIFFPAYGHIRILASQPPTSPEVSLSALGCGAFPLLKLNSTPPTVGGTTVVQFSGIPAGLAGAIYGSLLPSAPLDLGGGCMLALDPATLLSLGTFNTTTTGLFALSISLPQIPLSAGIELALQGVIYPTSAPRGFDISDGLRLRLGY